jgi:hypothetical protein
VTSYVAARTLPVKNKKRVARDVAMNFMTGKRRLCRDGTQETRDD